MYLPRCYQEGPRGLAVVSTVDKERREIRRVVTLRLVDTEPGGH